jgi:penicillin-binding protein 2
MRHFNKNFTTEYTEINKNLLLVAKKLCALYGEKIFLLFVITLFLVGCQLSATGAPTTEMARTPTPPLGAPSVDITGLPEPGAAARAYLDAWLADDYPSMYAALTSLSHDAITAEDFEKHHRGIVAEMALSSLKFDILSALVQTSQTAQVSYRVTFESSLVGEIQRNTLMNLSLEEGRWKVQWEDALVMPELAGGNYLGMERYIPARANIYDRGGRALVAQADATALGLRPDLLVEEQTKMVFEWLNQLTGLTSEQIQAKYANFPPGADWYLPLGQVPADTIARNYDFLSGLSGLELSPYKARFYFDGGLAPHLVGYVTTIQAEQEEEYLRKGYRRDERVGQAGLEKWGEEYLSGKRGGALYVFNSENQIETRLAERTAEASQAIYTTLDRDFQKEVERAIANFRGAIVVLERDTGRVLALASSPKFDPNAFEPNNRNSSEALQALFSDPNTPTFNRAAMGQYPPGSAFKIITLAAALESGLYTPETTYPCGYFFNEIAGVTLNDWTYDSFLADRQTQPSGLLTLPEGLIRSCNPYFWHIGLDLYDQGRTTEISNMARGFGLGKITGIMGIDEQPGQIPDPASQIDATNLAIGQGTTLITPLQAATLVAAVGNGGVLYRPQAIERIQPPDGDPSLVFKPEELGKLPVSPENLKVIQQAMRGVIASEDPFGTAWHRFTGLDILVAGKTGTAESGSGLPHAWFVGYTYAGRPDQPDIAMAVVVENAGEGSDYAAPIFRRVVELYFYGQPARLYPWEASFYVVRTPEPDITPTP